MRHLTDRIAQWPSGNYFLGWAGEEFLITLPTGVVVTTDSQALVYGDRLLSKLIAEQE